MKNIYNFIKAEEEQIALYSLLFTECFPFLQEARICVLV